MPELLPPVYRGRPDSNLYFEIYEDNSGEWRWHLKARNGNIVADSGEGYASHHNALRGMGTFRVQVNSASTVTLTKENTEKA